MKSTILWNILAIALGIAAGLTLEKSAAGLGVVAWIPISLIKGLASPLLFFAILHGLMSDQITGRGFRKMLFVAMTNAVAAVTIAVLLVDLFKPGVHLTTLVRGVMDSVASGTASTYKVPTWQDAIKSLVPDSVLAPFVTNNIPAILFLAILMGLSLRHIGRDNKDASTHWHPWFLSARAGVDVGLSLVSQMMKYVLYLLPVAIFASVAKATGEHGLGVFKGLAWYVVICVGGMLIQIIVVYQSWILFFAKKSLIEFWRYARIPVVYAFGVNSSLASLPSTLQALDHLKVSQGASRLGACVGTNFNNDGILLYEVAALLMLGQAAGLEWSLMYQLGLAGICVLATLGVSGFPEAGIVALSLVLSSAGLPAELLPLLIPVDWLVARMRSATNVVSDMTVSIAIDSRNPQVSP
ncbi:MAG: dicarboxylate/amino acid:cation symporter [Proteobacteria bacterium]|nr:dicarboxylate/amino acid:cation symporter [Pseudomonadota bacterium]